MWTGTASPSSGNRARRRSRISSAALRVKVIARHSGGEARRLATRWAMRWVRVRVLPEPGPATMSSGPEAVSTARRWSGSSPERRRAARSSGDAAAPGPLRPCAGTAVSGSSGDCEGPCPRACVRFFAARARARRSGSSSAGAAAAASGPPAAPLGSAVAAVGRGEAPSSPKRDAPRVYRRSSASSNSRIVPYTPSKPASRTTSWRRSRDTASATRDDEAGRMSSRGTASSSGSSGPSRPRRLS